MAKVRVIRSNPEISDEQLAEASMAATDLDADEASALVRAVCEAPTTVEGGDMNAHVLERIAAVLEHHGYEVAFDA